MTDDLVQDALEEALTAFVRAPPSNDDALAAWVATIARRVVADHLKKRGRRRQYEGSMPHSAGHDAEPGAGGLEGDGAPAPGYDPSDEGVVERQLRGKSLFRWLERQVAHSPTDLETFAILLEHELGDKTYKIIAAERGIPHSVLSSRIFEFRNKYIARYKRERDRMVLVLLFLFAAAVVAILVWLLWRHDEPPHETVRPPTPSILDRALDRPLPVSRPRPDDALDRDAGASGPPR